MQEHVFGDGGAQFDDAFLVHQRIEAHVLEVEVDELAFLLGGQVTDVHHHGEAVGGGFREGEGALAELDGVHGGDGEVEPRELVGGLADGDGAVLEAFEEGALRLEGDAVDFVEEDDLGLGQGAELGDEFAGGGVDHLEADDLGGLQVGASLEAREAGVADGGEDDAEERLADAGHPAQQEVARVDLALFLLVVGGGNLRQQDDVGQNLGQVIADQGLAALREDGFVERNGFFEVGMHDGA